jgi:hypothetical protein
LGLFLALSGELRNGLPVVNTGAATGRTAFYPLILFLLTLPFTVIAPQAFDFLFRLPALPVVLGDLSDNQ